MIGWHFKEIMISVRVFKNVSLFIMFNVVPICSKSAFWEHFHPLVWNVEWLQPSGLLWSLINDTTRKNKSHLNSELQPLHITPSWDLYSSLRVETKDIIELSTNRWSLQVATILDHLRWNKCFSCFFIIENLISLHCWQLTRQNKQSEDVASGSAKLCWAVSIIFLFFGGVPKPSLLEGQTSDLMVGRSPKANNYCIVKMQNGP